MLNEFDDNAGSPFDGELEYNKTSVVVPVCVASNLSVVIPPAESGLESSV
jgi:hypothetical protein